MVDGHGLNGASKTHNGNERHHVVHNIQSLGASSNGIVNPRIIKDLDSWDLPVEVRGKFWLSTKDIKVHLLKTQLSLHWAIQDPAYCPTYCLQLPSNINPHSISLFSGLWYSVPCKRWTPDFIIDFSPVLSFVTISL